jgi:hypothetical protein
MRGVINIFKVISSSKDQEKINRRVRRDRRAISGSGQKIQIIRGYELLFAFRSTGIEKNGINEEEAERTEIVP